MKAGQLDPQAAALLGQLAGAYVERSPSGTGVHAIVRAQLPGPGRRRGQVECYDRARYFTITGRALSAPGPIAAAQAAIEALYTDLGDQAGAAAAATLPAALDWGFVDWLEARMRRLISPDGLPYGATPQLRALLTRNELPAGLAATDSERRAVVVAQLAKAGRMPEETYLLARHIWARYGYDESNKRPQDLATDALRLLAKYQDAPGAYSAHSLARFQEYRHDPQRPQEAAPVAPQLPQAARRAVCTPDAGGPRPAPHVYLMGDGSATVAESCYAIGHTKSTTRRASARGQARSARRSAGEVRLSTWP